MKKGTKKTVRGASYDHARIEKKWQKVWETKKVFQAQDTSSKKKFYALIEFPYPSGDGLHVGHVRSNTAMDVISRKRRMEGYNVLYPIGWDAFGLPTENYAIKKGVSPILVTKQNTDTFRRQLKALGFSFDWSREINTTDPKYYKWTQWIFLQLLKHNLAYKAKIAINWCPKDKIGLANEEVVNGCCERCGTPVEKREKEQWMLRITKYADRLLKDLDSVDYLEKIKLQQQNWIGRSEGAEIRFDITSIHGDVAESVPIFTTRPDTLFGVTYVVLAPEHPFVRRVLAEHSGVALDNRAEVAAYVESVKNKTDIERLAEDKEKTGVCIKGITATNPATGAAVPVYVADYVLATYGTGAVMAVPAHDTRDFIFATKYKLPIVEVVIPNIIDRRNPPKEGKQVVERRSVHPIVRDKKTGKFLALKWKKFDWTTFPMGGIEEGESVEAAARREVKEETGFTDLKLVKILPGEVRAEYYAAHKDVNRVSYTTAVVFDLVSHAQVEISDEEKNAHDIIWLDEKELNYETMTHAEVEDWARMMSGAHLPFEGDGVLINSGKWTGGYAHKAKKDITEGVGGKWIATFKLRDWVFSRQRYWGEPIPVVHCEKCGVVPVPEKNLPVLLPKVSKYEPTDTGESPLAAISSWVNTKCPKCKGNARRETDVMPNWAGSSWYFLRYIDPKNNKKFADLKKLKKWMMVDWYNGGMEHTTLHLLYSRFWNKFLYDIGVVPTKEPYKKRTSHGLVLAEGGEKMSKSKGNVVNPDTVVGMYGADTLRLYEMFMGPFDQPIAWQEESIIGLRRFVEKVWKLQSKVGGTESKEATTLLHKTIQKVSLDIESMAFNTALSAMMILVNALEKESGLSQKTFETVLLLLAPFAPHVAEELWALQGHKALITTEKWPKADKKKLIQKEIQIGVQVNSKVRGEIIVREEMTEADVLRLAKEHEAVAKWLLGKTINKVIYVKGKLINIIVG